MASLLAQLPGPINLRLVLSDLKLSDILHDLVTAKGNLSGVPRALAVDRNETRELAGTLHIEAPGVPIYSRTYTDNIIPAMTSATAPSGVVMESGHYYAHAAWQAFDHTNPPGGFDGNWITDSTTGHILYQFPAAHVITAYAVTSKNEAAPNVYSPKTWTFKGSNDGTTWVTLDTQTNVTDWATSPNVRKVFGLANATAYATYGLFITASNDAGLVAVGELEMMETVETVVSYGSGKDDAIAQIRAINALVTVGTTLTLQSTGATNAVMLKVLPSRGVSQPLDELFELDGGPVLASCAFSFTCEPYAYGPEAIVFSEPVTLPDVINIDVPGDYRTPLSITFNPVTEMVNALHVGLLPNQTTPLSSLLHLAANSQYVVLGGLIGGNPALVNLPGHGLITGQTVEFWYGTTTPATNGIPYLITVVDADNFTIPVNVTAGGTVTVAKFTAPDPLPPVVMSNDTQGYTGRIATYGGTAGWARWEIDDRLLPPGTYLPLVRAAQFGAGNNNLAFSGGLAPNNGILVADTAGAMSLEAMPQAVHLPYYKMTPQGSTWRWQAPALWWVNGGGDPYLDYLALMPTSWGWASFHLPRPQDGSWLVTFGYDGTVYNTDVAADCGRSGGMSAVGAQSVFMVPGARHNAPSIPIITGNLVIAAIPRYALWR